MQELTEMLGFRPYRFYFYMWKFVSPLCMAVLTTASIIQLGVTPPGYSAWIKEEVRGDLNATGNREKPSQGSCCVPGPARASIFTTAQRERRHYPLTHMGRLRLRKVDTLAQF